MTEDNKIIEWQAPEFTEHEKNTSWHVIFTVIALLLIGYAVYIKSILSAITFVLLSILGWYFANKKPEIILYKLTSTGIVNSDTIIPYKNIKSFWIVYNPPLVKTLNFETTALLNRIVSIELGEQDPLKAREYLQNYITEDLDREESLTDIISRKAKF